MIKSKESILG